MEARWLTVGPVQENCCIARQEGATSALVIDPGDEPDASSPALDELGADGRGDPAHPHALRPRRRRRPARARAPARPCTAPSSRSPVLADIMRYVPWPGLRAVRVLRRRRDRRGRRAARARRLRASTCSSRPGHSPGHVDLLDRRRAGAVLRRRALPGLGRPHRPARRRPRRRCCASIATLLDALPDETARAARATWGPTTLGRERASNPFLRELAARERQRIQAPRGTFDVLPRRRARARRASSATRQADPRARRLRAHRDADVRGDRAVRPRRRARRPTSSRRRCTRSTTAAASRSRCARRAPRRSAAPTSSTGCTSSRSR